MPDFDDSLGGHTLGDADNEDRFVKSLGDQHTIGDANIEEDLLNDLPECVRRTLTHTIHRNFVADVTFFRGFDESGD